MVFGKILQAFRDRNTKTIKVLVNPAVPEHDEEYIRLEELNRK